MRYAVICYTARSSFLFVSYLTRLPNSLTWVTEPNDYITLEKLKTAETKKKRVDKIVNNVHTIIRRMRRLFLIGSFSNKYHTRLCNYSGGEIAY